MKNERQLFVERTALMIRRTAAKLKWDEVTLVSFHSGATHTVDVTFEINPVGSYSRIDDVVNLVPPTCSWYLVPSDEGRRMLLRISAPLLI